MQNAGQKNYTFLVLPKRFKNMAVYALCYYEFNYDVNF